MNQENNKFSSFLKIWAVIIILNQVFIFNGCFAIYCLLAAAPHTGFIAFLLSPIFSLKRFLSFISTFIEKVKGEVSDKEILDYTHCYKCNKNFDLADSFCIYCGESLQVISQEKERKNAKKEKQERKNNKIYSQLKNQVVNDFDGLLIALLSHLCLSNGIFSEKEKQFIHKTFSFLSQLRGNNSEHLLKIYNDVFKESNDSYVTAICKLLSKQDNISEEILLTILLDLAHVDGEYHEKEEKIILKVVHVLDIDFLLYKNILSKYKTGNENNSTSSENFNFKPTLDESYEILEAHKNMSFSDIKKNYRRLVRLYHTDTLASKNLPPELMKFSENKLKSINSAYKIIKEQVPTHD